MKKDFKQLIELQKKARREIELEKNKVQDRIELVKKILRIMDAMDELCAENERLKQQLADLQAEIDSLKQQLEQEA